ncbi:hypothetical protein B296_00018556 [Ensete ventricosum]|uniref:Ty3 transposon capsid-like protein domain-containing protein n=1 Tax=Ensete ventricosum TaxID=4639 RepID=A0A426YSB6_ENSVE|nr:hypothetical protein B296_00018556 [Ensete ventricosum]
MRSLFTKFSMGRPPSPKKSHQGEILDQRDDPQEHSLIQTLHVNVDFSRWEGDPIGWIARTERYFWFYRIADATRVEIAAIYFEGDVIQWFNWYEYTHGGLSWQRFKEGLLNHLGPIDFDNIDRQLAKIRQTSTIHKYQTRFEHLSKKQLLGTFIEGLKSEIRGEVKVRPLYTLTTAISFARI